MKTLEVPEFKWDLHKAGNRSFTWFLLSDWFHFVNFLNFSPFIVWKWPKIISSVHVDIQSDILDYLKKSHFDLFQNYINSNHLKFWFRWRPIEPDGLSSEGWDILAPLCKEIEE